METTMGTITELFTETNVLTESVNNFVLEDNGTLVEEVENVTLFTEEVGPELPWSMFEIFIILEIVMLILELLLSFGVAAKMKKWRKNYRNQMLTQICVARFFERVIGYAIFLEKKSTLHDRENQPSTVNLSLIIYINFVTIFLIFFLIKHMYDTLIVVFVKISKNSLYKVSMFSWLFPIPLTGTWIAFIMCKIMDRWQVDLIFCCLFKWTFTVTGTMLYVCILHKILKDKFRKFAQSLAIITFMLCLTINMYIVSSDISRLFRCFSLIMMKYVLGLVLNCLVLCLYIVLISSNFSHRIKHCDTMSNHSVGAVNREVRPELPYKYAVKYESQLMLQSDL